MKNPLKLKNTSINEKTEQKSDKIDKTYNDLIKEAELNFKSEESFYKDAYGTIMDRDPLTLSGTVNWNNNKVLKFISDGEGGGRYEYTTLPSNIGNYQNHFFPYEKGYISGIDQVFDKNISDINQIKQENNEKMKDNTKKNKKYCLFHYNNFNPLDHMYMILNNDGTYFPVLNLDINFDSGYFSDVDLNDSFISNFRRKNLFFVKYNDGNYTIENYNDLKNVYNITSIRNGTYFDKFFDFIDVARGLPLIPKIVKQRMSNNYAFLLLRDENNLEEYMIYPDRNNIRTALKADVCELLLNFSLPEIKVIKVGDKLSFKTEKGINSSGILIQKNISHSPNIWIIEDAIGNIHYINKKLVKKISDEKQDTNKIKTPLPF